MRNINLALLILSLGSASQDGERAPKEVTVVVSRKIKHGCEKDYDEWLRRLLILARKRPGYVGATTIMDDGTDSAVRHIIYRFSDRASLDAWENSEQFRKLIEEVNNYSNRYSQKATGFGADIANVQPGDDVAVFSAGPVGYFEVMSSFLRGAARVFSIDHWPKRL